MIEGEYCMDTPPLSFCLVHAKAADAPNRSSFPNAPVIGSVPPNGLPPVKYPPNTLTDSTCSPCLPPPAAAPPPDVDCPNAAWTHSATTTTVRICRAFISCSFNCPRLNQSPLCGRGCRLSRVLSERPFQHV